MPRTLILLGDLGGTNLRLYLLSAEDSSLGGLPPPAIRTIRVKTRDMQAMSRAGGEEGVRVGLLPALQKFVGEEGVSYCALSVNGPVEENVGQICSSESGVPGWRITATAIAAALSLPVDSVKILNDFVALGCSIPWIRPTQLRQLHRGTGGDGEQKKKNQSLACLGPGTGLGAVHLVWNELNQSYTVNPSEAGMASFAAKDEEQWRLREWCRTVRLGSSDGHLQVEALVSGEGIVAIYDFFRLQPEFADVAESPDLAIGDEQGLGRAHFIVSRATGATVCRLCSRAVDAFLTLLGQELGDMAMRWRPLGGLFLAGGVVSKLLPLLDADDGVRMRRLVRTYLDKGVSEPCVRDVPVLLCAVPGDELTYRGLWRSIAPSSLTTTTSELSFSSRLLSSHEEVSNCAAEIVLQAVKIKPDLVLCLATGSTPTRLYEILSKDSNVPLLSRVRIVQLDEWRGFEAGHDALCSTYLQRHVVRPWAVDSSRFLSFHGNAVDPEAECARVESTLESWGGIDVSILGLGVEGHLGFNEPQPLQKGLTDRAHLAQLAESSKIHAMLNSASCDQGLTLGMGALLTAKQTLLLVTGAGKSNALRDAVLQSPSSLYPASVLLRKALGQVVLLSDKAAAALTDL